MIDDHHPDGDEIASAFLDGEATPDEAALVARDVTLVRRVDDLRRVAEAVAAPVDPLPAATVDDLVATALVAATVTSPSGGAADSTASTSVVTDLDERRSARQARRWLAVAAVALVALALPLAFALRPEPQQDTFASVGSAVSDDGVSEDAAIQEADRDEALSAEAGAGADRSAVDESTASEAADAAPSTTVASLPPAPGAAQLQGVRWLGELGLLVDDGNGVAAAAAAALLVPMASTPPTTVGSFTLEASGVWSDAVRCAQEQVPGGALEGLAFAGVEVPGDVRVLVVRPPDGSGAVVLVVDGVNPNTADAPIACGTVLDVAPLGG